MLLLAPLAAVPPEQELRSGVERILAELDVEDARLAYEAIRLASPGGLGQAPSRMFATSRRKRCGKSWPWPPSAISSHGSIANGFAEVFDDGVPAVVDGIAAHRLD